MGKTLHSAGNGRSHSHKKPGPTNAELRERAKERRKRRQLLTEADNRAAKRQLGNSEADVVLAAVRLTLPGR